MTTGNLTSVSVGDARVDNIDCLEGMALLPSASIDLVLTDPPYEIEDMTPYFSEFLRLLKPSGSIYVFGDKNMVAEKWFAQLRIPFKELLIWHYRNSPKPRGRWRLSMQAIIYGYLSRESTFHEDEARVEYLPSTKKLNGRIRPSTGRYAFKEKLPYDTSKGALPRDVIDHPALTGHLARERTGHPDQKPLGLIERLMLASSNPGDTVLDAFAGSGTTAMAAINTGRRFIGFERDAGHFQAIRAEIEASS